MQVIDLKFKGLKLIKPKVFRDNRGFFLETYSQDLYDQHGITERFVQDNHSYSSRDCIRGMHFQSSPGQAKLVRVAHGSIFDVVVDMRKDSETYMQWTAIILDGENHHQLLVPVGFAHGFCVLSDTAHVLYKVSSPYDSKTEKGFRWDDPQINILWPVHNPIISDRDRNSPLFSEL